MADKKKGGLGSGYERLFMENATEGLSGGNTVMLKINEIEPDRQQPRKAFDYVALNELSESIKQHGVLQPLLIRPLPDGGYRIVAGERRWRAAQLAELTEVPVIIRDIDDRQAAQLALVENLQREDLNPVEEAKGLQRLVEEFSCTQEEAAEIVGRSRPAVANAIRLLSLPADLLALLENGVLTSGHGKALLGIQDEVLQRSVAEAAVKNGLSVRDTERLARETEKTPSAVGHKKKRNPYYDEVELALSSSLGRSVRLTKSTKKGILQIEFFDDDDLKKLLKIFDNDDD